MEDTRSKDPWWLGVHGVISGIIFLACWVYAIAAYGWFLGLAFGWIPALLIAAIWPLVAVFAVWLGAVIALLAAVALFVAWLVGWWHW